jgi:hypothetical protein
MEVWAHGTEDRYFVVAGQDGLGYYVTRYDVNGTFRLHRRLLGT